MMRGDRDSDAPSEMIQGERDSERQSMMAHEKSWSRSLLVVMLLVALAYWLWVGLTQRSITGDEGISILAGQSVLEKGMPELPSGMFYRKGILPSYMLGASFALLGVNDFSILLPSLLLGLGSLVLLVALARELFGRPHLGIAAGVWMLLLQAQTTYATSPRMYASLQFFGLLATYAAWRGFVRGRVRYQVVSLLAQGAAILSHAQSGALFFAIPGACLLASRLRDFQQDPRFVDRAIDPERQPRRRLLLPAGAYGALLALWVWSGLLQQLGRHSVRIADAGGRDPRNLDVALSVERAVAQLGSLEATVPLGLALAPLVVVALIHSLRGSDRRVRQGLVYAVTFFGICTAAMIVAIGPVHHRFWVLLLPIYTLLLCFAVDQCWRALHGGRVKASEGANRTDPASGLPMAPATRLRTAPATEGRMAQATYVRKTPATRRQAIGGLVGSVSVLTLASILFGAMWYPTLIVGAYGWPWRTPSDPRSVSIRQAHQELRDVLESSDRVVATNPFVARYYLGRVDFFLRERRFDAATPSVSSTDEEEAAPSLGEGIAGANAFGPFDSPTDEYLGIPLLDTLEELDALQRSRERIWVIADSKFATYSSPRMRSRIQASFGVFRKSESLTIYGSRAGTLGSAQEQP